MDDRKDVLVRRAVAVYDCFPTYIEEADFAFILRSMFRARTYMYEEDYVVFKVNDRYFACISRGGCGYYSGCMVQIQAKGPSCVGEGLEEDRRGVPVKCLDAVHYCPLSKQHRILESGLIGRHPVGEISFADYMTYYALWKKAPHFPKVTLKCSNNPYYGKREEIPRRNELRLALARHALRDQFFDEDVRVGCWGTWYPVRVKEAYEATYGVPIEEEVKRRAKVANRRITKAEQDFFTTITGAQALQSIKT